MTTTRRFTTPATLLGIVLPVIATSVGVALQLVWAGDLPDPIAVHWSALDAPDGFGSKASALWGTVLLGAAMPLAMTIPVVVNLRRGVRGPNLRFMIAVAAFFSVFMVWLLTGSLHIQRGLADAADTGSIGPVLLSALGAAAVAGILGWALQPRQETDVQTTEVPSLEVDSSERAVWASQVGMSTPILLLVGLGTVASAVGAAVIWISGETVAAIALTAVAVITFLIVFGLSRVRVTVDRRGLSVKAALGWPRLEVPIDDIGSVSTQEVSAVAEFGGYGVRVIPGATGVIMQSGEAINVTRKSGRRFVVTVDDAATGASLLKAYAQRHS